MTGSTPTDRTPELEVVLDLVCPWCRLGEARLGRALDRLGPDPRPVVRYRPFQLQPDQPTAGVPRREHFARAFGSWERAEAAFDRVAALGAAEGVPFRMDLVRTEPNTVGAHVLLQWAQDRDAGPAVARALFDAFFRHGADIGDRAVLAAVARGAGLDADAAASAVGDPTTRAAVARQARAAHRDGVRSVPTYRLGDRTAAGALDPDQLVAFLLPAPPA